MKTKHLPKITIETIPHKQQKSAAVLASFSDTSEGFLLKVSRARKLLYEAGWAIHELAEKLSILLSGNEIDFADIASFYEAHVNFLDPGSCTGSPNYKHHILATMVEKTFIEGLGYNWLEYFGDITPLEGNKQRRKK